MSKIQKVSESKSSKHTNTKPLTTQELKYLELDNEIESTRLAYHEQKLARPNFRPSQEEIKRIDDLAKAQREVSDKNFPPKMSDITKPVLEELIAKVKSSLNNVDEQALINYLIMQVQVLNDNSPSSFYSCCLSNDITKNDDDSKNTDSMGFVINNENPIVTAKRLIKKHFVDIISSNLDQNSDSELMDKSGIAGQAAPICGCLELEGHNLTIDFERLEDDLLNYKKRVVIENVKKTPLYALLGLLKWPFWRLSESGRSYAKHKKTEKRFSNYKC